MNYLEYKHKLEQSPKYQTAMKELNVQFSIANWVLKARLNKGWTQKQLADAVGTRQANISRIESGLGNPTLKFVQKVFNALDISMESSYVHSSVAEVLMIHSMTIDEKQVVETQVSKAKTGIHEFACPDYSLTSNSLTLEPAAIR